jgi:sugar/nucleoside kinase (ribokinase family)
MNPRRGIIAGGNWIVDQVKLLDGWPAQDALALIGEESLGNGGSPYNVLKDLALLGAPFPLEAVGLVGDDERGRWIAADCAAHGIDARGLRALPGVPTSYTDVMTVRSSGRRTFFHQPGASARLAPEHFDFRTTRARHFHLGYILLLEALDAPGPDGAPRAVQVLAAARAAGLATSIDVVSAAPERLRTGVRPVLGWADVVFINDYELEHTTGVALRENGALVPARVGAAVRRLHADGAGLVVFHAPEGGLAVAAGEAAVWATALRVEPGEIRGAAGAGDAFAAGFLFGRHEDWSLAECLRLGCAAAATCLFDPTCSGGVRSLDACRALAAERAVAARWSGGDFG